MNNNVKKLLTVVAVITFSIFSLFADGETTTITIKNARQTTYTKDKNTNNDLINLEGSVEISVSKGSVSSEIKADLVTYNRQSEMLYAQGNVEITTKSGSSGGETTSASALLMNTATLEGVFDDGRVVQTKSDAINLPSGSTLVVFADIFGKTQKNVIAFKNSTLTFCDDEDPHWKINASRTWLLPGGEFAFFNALLYVGKVPVMYFPAFYYPKDELIFNPVFGYATRTGWSVQTTTYVYGRKPLSSSSSSSSSSSNSTAEESLQALYNFMKPGSLKEQVREGLVLHNLDNDYSGDTSNYVKVMADWYSNLGVMAGVDGKLSPAKDYISNFAFSGYIAYTNEIYQSGSNYIPYNTSGQIVHETSDFLGIRFPDGSKLPFRFAGNFQFGLSKPFKLTLSLPLYSDPLFANDFLNKRMESMDWISYMMSQSQSSSSDTSTTLNYGSSFTWSLANSYSFTIPSFLKNYISSASVSTNSSITFSSKSDSSSVSGRSPEYKSFYYPSQIIPATVNFSISGTIFQYPKASSSSTSVNYTIALNQPDELKSESQIQKEKEAAQKAAEEAEKKAQKERESTDSETDFIDKKPDEIPAQTENKTDADLITPVLPELTHSSSLTNLNAGLNYKLTYSFTPSFTSQLSYSSSVLNSSSDFNWAKVRSIMYTAKTPASISSNLTYGSSFFSMTNKLSFDPVFQEHPYVLVYGPNSEDTTDNGGYTETSAESLKLTDYKAQTRTISNTNTIGFYPFINSPYFSSTGLSWNSTIKLYRREFVDVNDDGSVNWENYGLDFGDEKCITVNSVNLTLGAAELSSKLKQTLTLTAVLPPLLRSYTASVNLVFPYVTATFGAGLSQKTKDESVAYVDQFKKNSLSQTLKVSLLSSTLILNESSSYNIQDSVPHWESFKASASWKGLSLSYVMSYTTGYDLTDSGWEARASKEFLPYSATISYSPTTKTYYKWFNRITFTPGLSTSLSANLITQTDSYFSFTPNITFKINEFFNLTFSSTSKNSIIYWYLHNDDGDPYTDGLFGINCFPFNMLLDLANSFSFITDNTTKLRKSSGFKLKTLNVTMSHQLHDWAFNMTCSVSPKLVTKEDGTNEYNVEPTFSIGIVWNPMSSIKADLKYEYDEDEYKNVWALEE